MRGEEIEIFAEEEKNSHAFKNKLQSVTKLGTENGQRRRRDVNSLRQSDTSDAIKHRKEISIERQIVRGVLTEILCARTGKKGKR